MAYLNDSLQYMIIRNLFQEVSKYLPLPDINIWSIHKQKM